MRSTRYRLSFASASPGGAFAAIFVCCLALGASAVANAQGIVISASGPVNQSMGGAAVAAPLDAIGALRWNPATIEAVDSQFGFGLDLAWPELETSSSIPGLAAGTSTAAPGVTAIPSVGWVHRPEDSPWAVGLGVYAVAGMRTNFPASTTNPLFMPQSNTPGVPGGLGRVYTEAQFLQIAPTVALALSDQFSIGFSPNVTLGEVTVDPLVVAPPNDADGSGAPRYGPGNGTSAAWGVGGQLGVYYIVNEAWRLGAAIASPTWMEPFKYHSADELGRPVRHSHNIDLPMIISVGTSWAGMENLIVAVDVRYFDWKNTDGFGQQGYSPSGALLGLGWSNTISTALGVQYRCSESLYIRGGYTFCGNNTPDSQATANALAPLYYQHQLHVGGSYELFANVWMNLAYSYWPESEVSGPLVGPAGPVPGGTVTNRETLHMASLGLSVNY
jgi:long-chain fatty acid transport protein